LPLRLSKLRRCRWQIPPPSLRSRKVRRRRRRKYAGIGVGIGIGTATGKSERHEFNEPAIAGSFFIGATVICAPHMMTIMCLMQPSRASFRANLWPQHSWRVQVATSKFQIKSTIQRKHREIEADALKAPMRSIACGVRVQRDHIYDEELD
jgi:hypothetical protein